MARVAVKVLDTGGGPVQVGDVRIGMSETKEFDVKDSLSIKKAEPEKEREPGPSARDVKEGQHDNPNGIQNPGFIAPKMPKPGGHTKQVIEDDQIVERSIADDEQKVLQAGGPKAEKVGVTPGLSQEDLDKKGTAAPQVNQGPMQGREDPDYDEKKGSSKPAMKK